MFTCLFEGVTSNRTGLDYKIRHETPQWGVSILYIGFIHAIPWVSTMVLINTIYLIPWPICK